MRRRPSALARIEQATVQLPKRGGRGVLVAGGYILTAAHCVGWSHEGGMALGDHYLEEVRTRDGRAFRLEVAAVEPVADVAVLAEPDNLYEDQVAFGRWQRDAAAVPLYFGKLQPKDIDPRLGPERWECPALVYNLDRKWVKATAIVRRLG